YRRFYFRPGKLFAIAREMVADRQVMRRRLREGREFLQFLAARTPDAPAPARPAPPVRPAPRPGLQVSVPVPRDAAVVASVAAGVRAASAAATLEGVSRVVFFTESEALPGSWRRQLAGIRAPWRHVVSAASAAGLAGELDPNSPVLVIAPDTVPEPNELRELLAPAVSERRPTTWMSRGAPVGTYYPAARALITRAAPGAGAFGRRGRAAPRPSPVRIRAGRSPAWPCSGPAAFSTAAMARWPGSSCSCPVPAPASTSRRTT